MISIDMDMPNCCILCPIYNYEFGCCQLMSNSEYHNVYGEILCDPFEERLKDCPIKEVKE